MHILEARLHGPVVAIIPVALRRELRVGPATARGATRDSATVPPAAAVAVAAAAAAFTAAAVAATAVATATAAAAAVATPSPAPARADDLRNLLRSYGQGHLRRHCVGVQPCGLNAGVSNGSRGHHLHQLFWLDVRSGGLLLLHPLGLLLLECRQHGRLHD